MFQDTILSKYTSKRTKLHHIFIFFSGKLAYAPEHPSICVQPYFDC